MESLVVAEITNCPHTPFPFLLGIQLDCIFWASMKDAGAYPWWGPGHWTMGGSDVCPFHEWPTTTLPAQPPLSFPLSMVTSGWSPITLEPWMMVEHSPPTQLLKCTSMRNKLALCWATRGHGFPVTEVHMTLSNIPMPRPCLGLDTRSWLLLDASHNKCPSFFFSWSYSEHVLPHSQWISEWKAAWRKCSEAQRAAQHSWPSLVTGQVALRPPES